MVTVGARTSMGKTAFVLTLISDIIQAGRRVMYMSFEMTAEEIIERMFCNRYRIDNTDLLKGRFEHCLSDWTSFSDYLKSVQLVFASDFGKTWKEIDDFIQGIETKPDVIVIDYIQAIAGSSSEGKSFIDEYIRQFKQLAHEHGFCGILVSQLNRNNPDNKDKSPKLHELKGSGHIEDHSDVVLLLDWLCKHTESEDKSLYVVNIAKNRNGRTGYLKLTYEPQYYRFKEKDEEKQTIIRQFNNED